MQAVHVHLVAPRGAGETDKPAGPYSTELSPTDIASFLAALGSSRRNVRGPVARAATGLCSRQISGAGQSLSLHSCWTRSDPFLKTVVQGWQTHGQGPRQRDGDVIQGIFPWCFTPELYAAKPDYIEALAAFFRGRPQQRRRRSCGSPTP